MAGRIPNRALVFCLLLITISVGACGGLTQSDKPAVTSWWLQPLTGPVHTTAPQVVASISVSLTVIPGLDTDQILALSDEAELIPYAGARWVDNLPELTTSLVSRTLQASGSFEVVSERARAKYKRCDLRLELREFFASLDMSGQTRSTQIALFGSYQCESETPVPIQIEVSVPVHENQMRTIVAAFQKAMNDTMRELLKALHSV